MAAFGTAPKTSTSSSCDLPDLVMTLGAQVGLGVLTLALVVAKTAMGGVCDKATTQSDMETCYRRALVSADAELKQVYEHYHSLQEDEGSDLLARSQAAWEKFRKADCEAIAGTYGAGSYGPTSFVSCMYFSSKTRIVELKHTYEEPPVPPGFSAPPSRK
jgi:uncharacterized protein YecT (DUF1311 family)